jgi:hypothetical protein
LLLTTGLPSARSISSIASIWVVLVQLRKMPSASLRLCLRALRPFVRADGGEFKPLETERHVVDDGKAGRAEVVDHGLIALVGTEQDEAPQPERLQGFQHEAAGRQRRDPGCVLNDIENTALALRALGHRGIGTVEDDQIGRHVGEQLCRRRDLVGHRRERALPWAGDAGARDVHAETGRCKMVELRLRHAVDGGNDHSDPSPQRRQSGFGLSSLERCDGSHDRALCCDRRLAARWPPAQHGGQG